jgi:hypothetical protein
LLQSASPSLKLTESTGAYVVILTSMPMKQLIHGDLSLAVKVIDADAPGTGRIPRTAIRPYTALQPESKRTFERAFEELGHRADMKAGGVTADQRDFVRVSS